MIAAMCEQFVARAAEPFRLDELWPLVERLEHYGVAGFGWGATWLGGDLTLRSHRDTRAFRDDPARDEVGAHETTSVLVHLRRPSKLSTLQLPDTQPFVDPAGRFAFSHNGELEHWHGARDRYREQGRIHGRADSEVGQRWLEDAWTDDASPGALLAELHDGFGGLANLALLGADGSAHHRAGNRENPVFAFRLGRIGVASTALYSIDRSLFRFAATGATHRRLARLHTTVALDERGNPIDAGPARRPAATV
jgi:glutamine phosphoribosylpyrophosphate amidotransferase